jgi:hypothetical protein
MAQGVIKIKLSNFGTRVFGKGAQATSVRRYVTLTHTTNVGECVPILLKCIELNMVKKQVMTLGFINKNNLKNFSTQLINSHMANQTKVCHKKPKEPNQNEVVHYHCVPLNRA